MEDIAEIHAADLRLPRSPHRGGRCRFRGTAMPEEPGAPLNEFDAIEWRDVCRLVRPDLSDEEFEAMLTDFAAVKAAREHLNA
jgi:hypothetical protein